MIEVLAMAPAMARAMAPVMVMTPVMAPVIAMAMAEFNPWRRITIKTTIITIKAVQPPT